MKRNNLLEARRKSVPNEVRESVSRSFEIADRIHDILLSKGLKQKDLAERLNKSEAEICKWMRGTHNFTIDTLASIEIALGERIWKVTGFAELNICIPIFYTIENQSTEISYTDSQDNCTTVNTRNNFSLKK